MQVAQRSGIGTAAIVIIVIVIVGAGAGIYYAATASSSKSSSTTTPSSTTTAPTSTESSSSSTSISSSSILSSSTPSTSQSTSLTTSTTPSTTAQTSASTTYTATCATTTENSTQQDVSSALSVLQEFSSMTLKVSASESGQSFNGTYSYDVVRSTSSAYVVKVVVNASSGSESYSETYEFKLTTSGTLAWSYYGGENSTSSSSDVFIGAMAFFIIESPSNYVYTFSQFSQYFHASGSGTATIPSITVDYTTYTPNSTPVSFSECGESFTYQTFNLEVGPVQGTSTSVMVLLTADGTVAGQSVNFTIQLIDATLE